MVTGRSPEKQLGRHTIQTTPEQAEPGRDRLQGAWQQHWPEYLMEAAESASSYRSLLLEYPT
jgi:hypothetical protein